MPGTQAKEVTQVVCDDKEAMTTTEEAASIPDLSTILEIFGVTNKENEVDIDDVLLRARHRVLDRGYSLKLVVFWTQKIRQLTSLSP